jgi:hypothetical protein
LHEGTSPVPQQRDTIKSSSSQEIITITSLLEDSSQKVCYESDSPKQSRIFDSASNNKISSMLENFLTEEP